MMSCLFWKRFFHHRLGAYWFLEWIRTAFTLERQLYLSKKLNLDSGILLRSMVYRLNPQVMTFHVNEVTTVYVKLKTVRSVVTSLFKLETLFTLRDSRIAISAYARTAVINSILHRGSIGQYLAYRGECPIMDIDRASWSKIHKLQEKRTEAFEDDSDLDPEEIRNEIGDLANAQGFKRLGSGDFRVVYGDGDRVVKVAWHKLGKRENKSEHNNWNYAKDILVETINGNGRVSAETYLAHMAGHESGNFGWVLMEQVATGADNVTNEEASKLRSSLSSAGVNIDEVKPYNMGVTYRESVGEKVPVVFDYGGT